MSPIGLANMIKTREMLEAMERIKDQERAALIDPIDFLPMPNKTVVLITHENEILKGCLVIDQTDLAWHAEILSRKDNPAMAVERYLSFRAVAYWLG